MVSAVLGESLAVELGGQENSRVSGLGDRTTKQGRGLSERGDSELGSGPFLSLRHLDCLLALSKSLCAGRDECRDSTTGLVQRFHRYKCG